MDKVRRSMARIRQLSRSVRVRRGHESLVEELSAAQRKVFARRCRSYGFRMVPGDTGYLDVQIELAAEVALHGFREFLAGVESGEHALRKF